LKAQQSAAKVEDKPKESSDDFKELTKEELGRLPLAEQLQY
jgi:hypothetical protein